MEYFWISLSTILEYGKSVSWLFSLILVTYDGKEFDAVYASSSSELVYTFWISEIMLSLPNSIGVIELLALLIFLLILYFPLGLKSAEKFSKLISFVPLSIGWLTNGISSLSTGYITWSL